MNEFTRDLVWGLLRASAMLSLGFVCVWALLKILRMRSSATQELSWAIVLLLGVMIVPVPITLAMLPPDTDAQLASFGQNAGAPTPGPLEAVLSEPNSSTKAEFSEPLGILAEDSRSHASAFSGVWFLAMFWITGFVIALLSRVGIYLLFIRQLRRSVPRALPDSLQNEWTTICQAMAINHSVPIRSAGEFGPCVCWLSGQTQLIVPESWDELSVSQRKAVLRHEAAHVKRRDLWRNTLFQILACVQWFNPLAWLCTGRLSECAEWACDDVARRSASNSTTEYVEALMGFSVTSHQAPAIVSAASSHSVVRRARRLLSPNVKDDSTMKKLMTMSVLACLLAAGSLNLNLVAAQNDEPETALATDVPEEVTEEKVVDLQQQTDYLLDLTYRHAPDLQTEVEVQPIKRMDGVFDLDEKPEPTGTREAVVDMSYLFKKLPQFKKKRDELQEHIRSADKHAKLLAEAIQLLNQQLKGKSGKERMALEDRLAKHQADLSVHRTSTQRKLSQAEAEIYASTYKQVRTTIAEYAKAHDIDIVRKVAIGREEQKKLESKDPQAIMKAINAQVLYVAKENIDITDNILELMKQVPLVTETEE